MATLGDVIEQRIEVDKSGWISAHDASNCGLWSLS